MTTVNPTLHTAAVASLELAVNRALALDATALDRLAPLDGCAFRLSCTSPVLEIVLLPGAEGLQMCGEYDGKLTTTLRGEASDFARLISAGDPTSELINGQLELEGDSAPLVEMQKVMAGLELDWEAPLVENLGDVIGHQVAGMMRGLFGWGRQANDSLTRQLGEFIQEEARFAPPRLEIEDFYDDVRQLGQRVDRLEARMQRLQKRARALADS